MVNRCVTVLVSLALPALCEGAAETPTDVQQLYEAAQQARARGDLSTAEAKYLEVIRRAPQLVNAYHNLGIVYFAERKYGNAASTLEKAVKLNPRLSEAQFMLGLALYELYEPSRAVRAFEETLRLNPSDANALLYLGKAQLQMRDYRASARSFEKLAESKPKDPDVLYNLSLSYMKLMLESVNRLGAVAPQSYQFSLLMAQDAESRNFDEEAIKKYQEALAQRGNHDAVGVHYALGSLYAKSGKFDEAAGEFQKELKINPNDSLALWKLGEIVFRSDPGEARIYFERAVGLHPNLPQAALAYGRILAYLGETEKAIGQFQRVVRLAPEEYSVHYHLFKAYRRLGRAEEASKELARFQEMAKKKSEETYETARRLMNLGPAEADAGKDPEPGFSPQRDPVHE